MALEGMVRTLFLSFLAFAGSGKVQMTTEDLTHSCYVFFLLLSLGTAKVSFRTFTKPLGHVIKKGEKNYKNPLVIFSQLPKRTIGFLKIKVVHRG